MRIKRVWLLLLVLPLFLPAIALGELEKGDAAPDIEAETWLNTNGRPISISDLRGMVVVLYFWNSSNEIGERLMPQINVVNNQARPFGVYLMGVTPSSERHAEEVAEEYRLFFPIAARSTAGEDYEIESYPHIVVIDTLGSIAFSGWPKDGILGPVEETLEERPPFRTHPDEARKTRELLDEAREFVRAGNYHQAIVKAHDAYQGAVHDDPLKWEVANMLDLIEALAREDVARGTLLLEQGDHEEGIQTLQNVSKEFRGTYASRQARRKLRYYRKHYPEVKRAFEDIERRADAEEMLHAAARLLLEREFGEAYKQLDRIVSRYGDTPSAETAKKLVARIESHDTIIGHVRDAKARRACESLLAEARSYRERGDYRRAERLLREIIDEYPDTIYRELAYRELEKLP